MMIVRMLVKLMRMMTKLRMSMRTKMKWMIEM